MSTSLNTRDEYFALKSSISYPPSPPLSHDSDDSLRALEISEDPATNPRQIGRYIPLFFSQVNGALKFLESGRSYSIAGFDFQRDLVR